MLGSRALSGSNLNFGYLDCGCIGVSKLDVSVVVRIGRCRARPAVDASLGPGPAAATAAGGAGGGHGGPGDRDFKLLARTTGPGCRDSARPGRLQVAILLVGFSRAKRGPGPELGAAGLK